ncbi:hypothetical protein GN958_ATG19262 [Phytophthora infestans]|uniref:Uncharacterized protein n=1 Tax=Phytophthora infestans TaxID=4787 RepID=A0A8S9TS89_PHYIN|nr:hypothetical protein GN958_ATG19262 [Phytophthora infestans]KAI9998339.1 hypothetical protein PInf_002721 [Phytophthora infestans]
MFTVAQSFMVSLSAAVTKVVELMRTNTESMFVGEKGMLELLALTKFHTFWMDLLESLAPMTKIDMEVSKMMLGRI